MTEQQPQQQQDAPTPGVEDQGEQLVLTSPEDAQTPKDFALWAGVILLAALTIYSPALRGDFLWDDDRHVSRNPNLRDLRGLVNIWTKWGVSRGGTVQYYPLTHTSFWLEYQLSGAEPGRINTFIFHVTNVVLHVIAAVLLWLVLRELKVPGSWVAAAIWALHPVQVESVAWLSERKNVLAGAFFFGSILAYLRSGFGLERRDDPREEATRGPAHPGLYWLSLGLFVCALLSKSVSCAMPAVVLLLLWWKRGRLTIVDFAATAPFFVLGVGMAVLTTWMEHQEVGASGAMWDIPFHHRILIAGRAIWFYVEKNLWPADLTFIYPRWNLAAAPATWWFFPAAVVAVIAVLFALRNRIGRGPVVAFLIFCGLLFPALGFINFYPMRYSFVADHFQYLAGPAVIALIVATVTLVLRRIAADATAAPYVLAGFALVILSALTLLQTRVYAGPLLLWDDAIKKNPNSAMLRYNYGYDLMLLMDQLPPAQAAPFVEEATRQFEAVTKLSPKDERAWTRWGRSLAFLGKHEEALEKFDHALKIRPDSVDALLGRGRSLYDLKKYDEALKAFHEALAAAQAQRAGGGIPRIIAATIYQYLGRIAVQKDDLEAAAKHYAEAVNIEPNSSIMHYEYGQLLVRQAELTKDDEEKVKTLRESAAEQFVAAIDIRPSYFEARVALAELLMDVENLPRARAQLDLALRTMAADPALRDQPYEPLVQAIKRWDAEMRQREAAATRPATTRAAATMVKSADRISETSTAPATRPSSE